MSFISSASCITMGDISVKLVFTNDFRAKSVRYASEMFDAASCSGINCVWLNTCVQWGLTMNAVVLRCCSFSSHISHINVPFSEAIKYFSFSIMVSKTSF